jgi:hypothetical protein
MPARLLEMNKVGKFYEDLESKSIKTNQLQTKTAQVYARDRGVA